ncbi:wax ester/triacylglycerol synthase domain-containing protein [Mycobacterium sp. HNNTM2301]|uniref:wax ester/triacylglycerol synthase domain-containing protein n=1 Tax=Mycobacterium hainanense TaxID=3289775 RepID=UPI0035A609B5
MNTTLDLVDQTFFRLGEAAGVGQNVWVYNRAIDIDGLRRFHQHLQQGRLARRIERSPLRFGRHRWVTPSDRNELEIATPRPREDLDAWLCEQANIPLDVERGPAWHLAVLPFIDGGAAVSFVVTHCLTDGIGGCLALVEAACGYDHPVDLPAAGSRPRGRALREDARQAAHDIPAIRRALAAAVATARSARRDRRSAGSAVAAPATPPAPIAGADETITLPTAAFFLDADEWDARAQSLGGTSNTLLAGVASRLAQRVGRVGADGSVALALPVSERTADDTRANAVTMVDITIDPATATTDLREIRGATKRALIRHREMPDERRTLLPLVPLLPQRLIKRMVGVATGGASNVVVASNIGVAPPAANRPDGTDADYVALLSRYPGLTRAMVDQFDGLMVVHSATVHRQVFISVLAYQPGRLTSNEDLRQHVSGALNDFSLTATTGWSAMSQPADAR